jgi:hypothetical protein
MTGAYKGLVLAGLQLVLVLSLAGKLLYDRETRPRVWVECRGYDPDLPIRGRYLAEQLVMPADGFTYTEPKRNEQAWYMNRSWAYFELRNGQVVAERDGTGSGGWIYLNKNSDGTLSATTEEPVLVFVADQAAIPTPKMGQQMWVQVTIPKKGPPRPVQVGLKKDGAITPINL